MNTYFCKACKYVSFNQAPVNCPVCRAPIENFIFNPEVINIPQDPENLNEFERKHIPLIRVSKENILMPNSVQINVHVKVGEVEHPMDFEDYIVFIDFYLDDFNSKKIYLSRVGLRHRKTRPAVTLQLRNNVYPGVITVIGNCNSHGSWMAKASIKNATLANVSGP